MAIEKGLEESAEPLSRHGVERAGTVKIRRSDTIGDMGELNFLQHDKRGLIVPAIAHNHDLFVRPSLVEKEAAIRDNVFGFGPGGFVASPLGSIDSPVRD